MSSFYYTLDPVVEMRKSAYHLSEVVSQSFFGEEIEPIAIIEGDWQKIRTSDGYEGWVPIKSFIKRLTPYAPTLKISRLTALIYSSMDTTLGPICRLPYEAALHPLELSDPRWIKVALPDSCICYIQRGDTLQEPLPSTKEELVTFSQKFLGLPYVWGGRTSFGYDCSGFVQMLYRQIKMDLPRDSKDQCSDKRGCVIDVKEVKPCDLVFFGSPHIGHVGMCIGGDQFIHSTVGENQPWIRISHFSDLEWSGKEGARYPYRTFRRLLKN